jgi:hypothetical protein
MENRIKALAQHLEIEYFDYDGNTYTGMSMEEFEEKEKEYLDTFETRKEVDAALLELISENCDLIENSIIQSSYDDNSFEAEGGEY